MLQALLAAVFVSFHTVIGILFDYILLINHQTKKDTAI